MKKVKDAPNHVKDNEADIATRRRIIKGLVSVPAVLTLSSGTARAAASSLQCIGKVTTDVTLNTNQANTPTFDCKDPSVTTDYLGTGVTYDASETIPSARKLKTSGPGNNKECVIFVDSNGQNETFNGTVGQTAVTASCYTSFV